MTSMELLYSILIFLGILVLILLGRVKNKIRNFKENEQYSIQIYLTIVGSYLVISIIILFHDEHGVFWITLVLLVIGLILLAYRLMIELLEYARRNENV